MASLRVVGADGSERVIELPGRKVQIGRGRNNDITLEDPEKGVSRTHAELHFENGRYVIVDLQSQNGTWVNGVRVDRAEVPPGAEIIIGDYRLTVEKDAGHRRARASAGTTVVRPMKPLGAAQIAEQPPQPAHQSALPSDQQPTSQRPRQRSAFIAAALVAGTVILAGAVAWVWAPGRGNSGPAQAEAPKPVEPRAPDTSAPPLTAEPPPTERALEPTEPFTPKISSPRSATTDRSRLERVARKPGESVDAWKTRSEALATRYAYSKAALDRGDYAAAAGGFQAILREDPGFPDAAQLLVQANAGLRAVGMRAISEAKQLEAIGRTADAVSEYKKALQWLPAGDPNRQVARARLAELQRAPK